MERLILAATLPKRNGRPALHLGLSLGSERKMAVRMGPDLKQPLEMIDQLPFDQGFSLFRHRLTGAVNAFAEAPTFDDGTPSIGPSGYTEETILGIRYPRTDHAHGFTATLVRRWEGGRPLTTNESDNPFGVYNQVFYPDSGQLKASAHRHISSITAALSDFTARMKDNLDRLAGRRDLVSEVLAAQPNFCSDCGDERVRVLSPPGRRYTLGVACGHEIALPA